MKNLIILLLFFTGCDLFTTRDPENPDERRTSFITPTSPENLFANLKNAFKEKVAENYIACLVDSAKLNRKFVFQPSSGSTSLYPGLENWSLNSERSYFNNMKSSIDESLPIILTLMNETAIPQGDSAVYQFDYKIDLPINDPSIPDIYEGSVQFKIQVDRYNLWVITEWIDIKKTNLPSWSELKGRFY